MSKEYNRAYKRAYDRTAHGKAVHQAYQKTSKPKAYMKDYLKKYRHTATGKAALKKGKQKWIELGGGHSYFQQYVKAYMKTPKGKAIAAIQVSRRRTISKQGDLTPNQWLSIKYQSPICPMCGRFVECENLTLDHIIPVSKGGQHTRSNVQPLCRSCNARKGNRV